VTRPAATALSRACSRADDPVAAARELRAQLAAPDLAGVLLFCSSHYDLPRLAEALQTEFGDTPVVGCTSSGELTPFGYLDGTVTGVGFHSGAFVVSSLLIDGVSAVTPEDLHRDVRALMDQADADEARLDGPARRMGVFLVDGLCGKEEMLTVALHDAMGEAPLIGGSTGDDLAFKETFILHGGRFHPDAALLLLLSTTRPFRVFRHQHFTPTSQKMVVTEAQPASRIVTEINAEPAAQEYARIVGAPSDQLTPAVFAMHPVMVRAGGEHHVRSIQKVNDDGSLTFFCAIDEGIVLTVAEVGDMARGLEELFEGLRHEIGPPELVLAFDCVLRALEIEQKQLKASVSSVLLRNNVIGFSTYGEQFNAMHVNQTFTGVAIGGP
jgi:hypothetical protein